jgi:sulfite exporter TauE/SafE
MFLSGLSLLGKIKFLTLIEHSLSSSQWYQKNFKELLHTKTLFSFYILGMLNGLLPCGLVYFFAVTAASTGSAMYGAFVMLIFGLSTMPALFSLGFFVGLYKNGKFRNIMIKIASISVLLFGIYTIKQGYEYIKYPQKTIHQCCEFDPDTIEEDKK